jgi:hypothetical protein
LINSGDNVFILVKRQFTAEDAEDAEETGQAGMGGFIAQLAKQGHGKLCKVTCQVNVFHGKHLNSFASSASSAVQWFFWANRYLERK